MRKLTPLHLPNDLDIETFVKVLARLSCKFNLKNSYSKTFGKTWKTRQHSTKCMHDLRD